MDYEINPFQELYVTDSPDPSAFVSLFSDYLVQHVQPLFQPGNVIIQGTQGSGKSMLLNLLKPNIRNAYFKANKPFPVVESIRKYLGAGINLTRSGALDFGQRPLSHDLENDLTLFPLYFADFLNYYLVRDILNSVNIMRKNGHAFQNLIDDSKLEDFSVELGRQDCWFGSLSKCKNFSELCNTIDERISNYRAFHQFNSGMPPSIDSSKTNIGEPIARTAKVLKSVGVLPEDTPIFIRIDQLERLYRSDVLRPELGSYYRQIINKALSTRDSRVSYRIGTRTYAWNDDLLIYGTEDKLEQYRDFRRIDLDSSLRRKENSEGIFPGFAKDAFRRRIFKITKEELSDEPIKQVFGESPQSKDAAKYYAGNAKPGKILKFDKDWPDEWCSYLEEIYEKEELLGFFAVASLRQEASSPLFDFEEFKKNKFWERPYWKKERSQQAIMQIAKRAPQRLKWYGEKSILALSGGNISIFLSICHEVWDSFLRAERRKDLETRSNPIENTIKHEVQSVGIQTASVYWYEKIIEQHKGHSRQRFIDVLGQSFQKRLLADLKMSYPGHNGFSIIVEELAKIPELKRFLNDASDYGDLYSVRHTTKEKDRKQREKWYLSPILSDYFQLPEIHTKEPQYINIVDIIEWLKKSDIVLEGVDYDKLLTKNNKSGSNEETPDLFESLK